jgi:NAD(P)-dependent dehydrogenase (short-subunit alcohol dehydrogenase family)
MCRAIVNVGSVLGQVARPNAGEFRYYLHCMETDETAPYCGAKGAAISITQADALDVSISAVYIGHG